MTPEVMANKPSRLSRVVGYDFEPHNLIFDHATIDNWSKLTTPFPIDNGIRDEMIKITIELTQRYTYNPVDFEGIYFVNEILYQNELGLAGLKMIIDNQIDEVQKPIIDEPLLSFNLNSYSLDRNNSIFNYIKDIVNNRTYTPLHAFLSIPYLLLRRDDSTLSANNLLTPTFVMREYIEENLKEPNCINIDTLTYSKDGKFTLLLPQDNQPLLIKSLLLASRIINNDPSQLVSTLYELGLPYSMIGSYKINNAAFDICHRARDLLQLIYELDLLHEKSMKPLITGLVTIGTIGEVDSNTSPLDSLNELLEKGISPEMIFPSPDDLYNDFFDSNLRKQVMRILSGIGEDLEHESNRHKYAGYEFIEQDDLDTLNTKISNEDSILLKSLNDLLKKADRERSTRNIRQVKASILPDYTFERFTEQENSLEINVKKAKSLIEKYAESSVEKWTELLGDKFSNVEIISERDKQELLDSLKQFFSIFQSDRNTPQTIKSICENLTGEKANEEYSIKDIDKFLTSSKDKAVLFKWLFVLRKQGQGKIFESLSQEKNNISLFHLARTMLYQLAVTARGSAIIPPKIQRIIATPIRKNDSIIIKLKNALTTLSGNQRKPVISYNEQVNKARLAMDSIYNEEATHLLDTDRIERVRQQAENRKYLKVLGQRIPYWYVARINQTYKRHASKMKKFVPKKIKHAISLALISSMLTGGAYTISDKDQRKHILNILNNTASYLANSHLGDIIEEHHLNDIIGSSIKPPTEEIQNTHEVLMSESYNIPGAIDIENLVNTEPFMYGIDMGGFDESFVPFSKTGNNENYISPNQPSDFTLQGASMDELLKISEESDSYMLKDEMINNIIYPPENKDIIKVITYGGSAEVSLMVDGGIILEGELPEAILILTEPASLTDISALIYGDNDPSAGRLFIRNPQETSTRYTPFLSDNDYRSLLYYNAKLNGDPVLQKIHRTAIDSLFTLDWSKENAYEDGSALIDTFIIDLTRHIVTTRTYDLTPIIIDPYGYETYPVPVWVSDRQNNEYSGFYCQTAAILAQELLIQLGVNAHLQTGYNFEIQNSIIWGRIGHQKVFFTNFNGKQYTIDLTPSIPKDEQTRIAFDSISKIPTNDEFDKMLDNYLGTKDKDRNHILENIQRIFNLKNTSIGLSISSLLLAAYIIKKKRKKELINNTTIDQNDLPNFNDIIRPGEQGISDTERLLTTSLYLLYAYGGHDIEELNELTGNTTKSIDRIDGKYLGLITVLYDRLIRDPQSNTVFFDEITSTEKQKYLISFIKSKLAENDEELRNMLPDYLTSTDLSNDLIPIEIEDMVNIFEVLFRANIIRDSILLLADSDDDLLLQTEVAESLSAGLDKIKYHIDNDSFETPGIRIVQSLKKALSTR